jgi:periplasmic protein TonB
MTMSFAIAAPDLAQTLFQGTERHRAWSALGWLAALTVHASLIGLVSSNAVQARSELRPVEVEILPPELAPVKEAEPPPEPTTAPRAAAAPSTPSRAPAAARAGTALTAKADAPAAQQPDEPYDFTSDPNGTSYGAGVVAVGGKADFGAKGAQVTGKGTTPTPAPLVRNAGEALIPLADLSRKPRLDEADPCRGYFPRSATDDDAQVSLHVVIGKSGKITSAVLLSEDPPGQGFGAAAKACLLSKRLAPALDRDGNPAATATRINLRFIR